MLLPRLLSTSSLPSFFLRVSTDAPLVSIKNQTFDSLQVEKTNKPKIIQESGSGYSRFSSAAPFSRLSSTTELILSPSFLPSLPHASSTLQYMGTEPCSRATGGIVAIYDFGIAQSPHHVLFFRSSKHILNSHHGVNEVIQDVTSSAINTDTFNTFVERQSTLWEGGFVVVLEFGAARQCNLYIDGNSLVQTDFSRSLSVHL